MVAHKSRLLTRAALYAKTNRAARVSKRLLLNSLKHREHEED